MSTTTARICSWFPKIKKSDYTCKKMIKRTLADNPSIKKQLKNMPNGYYKEHWLLLQRLSLLS